MRPFATQREHHTKICVSVCVGAGGARGRGHAVWESADRTHLHLRLSTEPAQVDCPAVLGHAVLSGATVDVHVDSDVVVCSAV